MPRANVKKTKKKPDSWRTTKLIDDGKGENSHRSLFIGGAIVCALYFIGLYFVGFTGVFSVEFDKADAAAKAAAHLTAASSTAANAGSSAAVPTAAPLDIAAYNAKLIAIANEPPILISTTTSTSTIAAKKAAQLWPVKAPYPLAGALLPFHRIVAYYGNFYSTHMGVLGEYPPATMIPMLMSEVAKWNAADPSTPAIPGIDYIAVTAQGSPGADGMYRDRMPDSQIQEAISLAKEVNGIVILDIQVGDSTVETEVPLLKQYLEMPNVELALDPEFAMHDGAVPGSEIGSLDASDINWTANYLAQIVTTNNLPPKILIVHRFTADMVTRAEDITALPQVQIVMDMDGWGSQAKKLNTYQMFIANQPVQFTGFKLFYVNDLRAPSTGMLTPAQLLKLTPQPLFIQYQ
jgi:hypothetical protein